jgi:hypothetical protein
MTHRPPERTHTLSRTSGGSAFRLDFFAATAASDDPTSLQGRRSQLAVRRSRSSYTAVILPHGWDIASGYEPVLVRAQPARPTVTTETPNELGIGVHLGAPRFGCSSVVQAWCRSRLDDGHTTCDQRFRGLPAPMTLMCGKSAERIFRQGVDQPIRGNRPVGAGLACCTER